MFAYRIFRLARWTDFANVARSLWEPDIERFTAARDIGLTVEYGSDGLACQIIVERKQPLLHSKQIGNYMAPEAVSEIIDELVPPASRRRSTNSMIESMGCAEGRIEEYENV